MNRSALFFTLAIATLSVWLLISRGQDEVKQAPGVTSFTSHAVKSGNAKPKDTGAVQPTAESFGHRSDQSQQVLEREALEQEALERAVERLAQGVRQGLSADAITRRLEGLPPQALATFFERHTHISSRWLHDNGLSPALLSELYRLYALDGPAPQTDTVQTPLGLTRQAGQGAASRYRNVFADIDTTIFLHYRISDTYGADAVIVRWLDADNRSLVHLDRHYLPATAHEVQEAWIRRPKGWAPGEYRVEIFAADSALTPLAATDYRVFRYGVD